MSTPKAMMSDTQLATLIEKGIHAEFASLMKQRLQDHAAAIIESVANEVASNVVGRVTEYYKDTLSDQIRITIQFGEKK